MLEYLYGLSESVAGREARRFFPLVVTIFLLVIISNWSGLISGVGSVGFYHESAGDHARWLQRHSFAMADGKLILAEPAAAVGAKRATPSSSPCCASADLNMTFALAIVTMVMVQVWGVRASERATSASSSISGEGFMRYVNGFVGILELVSEFSRVIAFGFRLFGNIFAGEIVLATMAFLITFWLPIPFYVLEIFVGFVQAMVFMMLALVFFSMATISHGHEHGH